MRRIKAFLLLLLFVVISPALAFEDDFQNHPGDLLTDVWNITGAPSIIQYPPGYSQNKGVSLANNKFIRMETGYASNYWSFVSRTTNDGATCTYHVKFYNETNVLLRDDNLFPAGCTANTLLEFIISGGVLSWYKNGVSQGALGAIADTPYYIGIDISFCGGCTGVIDDVSTSGIVGTNNQFTELNSDFQTTYSIYAKYSSPSSTYQQRVRKFSDGSIINTTTLSSYSGYTVYDRLAVFGTNYGYYQIYTTKDGILEASHNILYVPSVSIGSVSMDKDDYPVGDDIVVTYSLITPDYGTYDYKAYLVRLSDFSTVATQSITSDSGTKTFDTSTYTADTYYVFLARTSGGTQQDFAYDFADLNDAVFINGVTYNAESGAALANASVNDSQGATWFNDTSDASGVYNLTGISVSVNLNINASLTNYTHTNWSFTPLAGGSETVNLYLIPTAPTYTGTAILGLVGSYPWHQAINGATVNIWNASWSSSATASATGYYIFNSLANGSTYSMNATKTGYTAASTTNVTVVNGSFVVQNFVLVPGYTLTVKAKDSVTGAYLSSFSTNVNGTDSTSANGSTTHSLDYGLYTITVSAADHYSASVNTLLNADKTVTLELTPTGGTSTIFKVLPHDVKFIVQDVFGRTYSGVTVTVQGYNTTTGTWEILQNLLGLDFATTPINNASMSGITGSDGAIVFKMSETIYYNINVSGTNPIISNTFWLYPKDDLYYLTVSASDTTWNDYSTSMTDGIVTTVSKGTFNTTHAWINTTYNDSLAQTTSLIVYVNQSNSTTGNLNQTVISSWTCSSGCNATSHNFTISPYDGQSYIVNIRFVHSTYGTNTKSYAVIFPKTVTATGIPQIAFLFAAVLIMVFVGAIFTYSTAELGLIITCGIGWIFWIIGWFNASDPSKIGIGLTLGTFVAIVAYIAKQSEKGRYT